MKKITSKLYIYIVFWILIGLLISISISYIVNYQLISMENENLSKIYTENYEEVSNSLSAYQSYVTENSLESNTVRKHKFTELYENYTIRISNVLFPINAASNNIRKSENRSNRISEDSELFEDIENESRIRLALGSDSISSETIIYPIQFTDKTMYIYAQPINESKTYKDLTTAFTILLGIFIFLIILYLSLKRVLKYIGEIERGVSILAGGSLSYEIPLQGNNELTDLANSINQMSNSLKEKNERDKALDLNQKRLITNMSHDLRTPLTSIIGYINVLQDEKYSTKEEMNSYLKTTKDKSLQLQKLINDLFEYTKLANKEMNKNIADVNIETFTNQYVQNQSRKVHIEKSCDRIAIVKADTELTKRIYDNLFDNIRKYATENSDIFIGISYDEKENYMLVKITNESAEDLTDKCEYIFERMYISKESRNTSASGLGLSIVKEGMKLMQGDAIAEYEKPNLSIVLKFKC